MSRPTLRPIMVLVMAIATTIGALGVAVTACSVGDIDITNRECPCSAAGYVCDPSRNICILAADLLAESGLLPVDGGNDSNVVSDADVDSGVDAGPECTTTPTDTCSAGFYCVAPALQCAPGCKSDAECLALSPSSPYCNTTRHQCVACRGKADCPVANQDCAPSGVCSDACALDGGGCAIGKQCCGGLCVDTKSDVFNCNGCGTACSNGNTLCCNGICKNPLIDPATCGSCGNTCSTLNGTPSCSSGTCRWTCNAGFAHCAATTSNTGCETSTTANILHCGNCLTNCNLTVKNATGITCASSQCNYTACNAGFAECNLNRADGCDCTDCGNLNQPCCAVVPKCNGTLNCKAAGGMGVSTCQP